MKNHFYMSYNGNKREEVDIIYNLLDLNNINTIIEPFCGTCAVSYYISTKKQGLKYIFNDNNKYLLEMFNIIKDDNKLKEFENKIIEDYSKIKDANDYNNYLKDNNIYSWFIASKYYNIRKGLYPLNRKFSKLDFNKFAIVDFFKNNDIEFYNKDAIDFYEQYKNKEDCLIIMDPPYLQTCNDFYLDKNVNIYEYLYNNDINKEKAKIYLILEDNWIIKLLFKNNIIKTYDKLYQPSKKQTKHIIIKNNL